ncbi:hypothetical protein J7401_18295, partial [Xanthomonas phaseoli pv. dieffenbachiae]
MPSTNSTMAMMMPAQNRNLAIPIAAPAMRAKPAAAPDATLGNSEQSIVICHNRSTTRVDDFDAADLRRRGVQRQAQ